MTFRKICAGLVTLTILATSAASAQTITAFNTGSRTTDMTKLCYYEALGSQHSHTVQSVEQCPMSIKVSSDPTTTSAPQLTRIRAFKTGERTTRMTKLCIYDGLSGEYTKTIKSAGLCAISIWVRPRS